MEIVLTGTLSLNSINQSKATRRHNIGLVPNLRKLSLNASTQYETYMQKKSLTKKCHVHRPTQDTTRKRHKTQTATQKQEYEVKQPALSSSVK